MGRERAPADSTVVMERSQRYVLQHCSFTALGWWENGGGRPVCTEGEGLLEAESFWERERQKSKRTKKLTPESEQKLGLRTAASSCGAVTAQSYQDTEPELEFCLQKAIENHIFYLE